MIKKFSKKKYFIVNLLSSPLKVISLLLGCIGVIYIRSAKIANRIHNYIEKNEKGNIFKK